MNQTVVIYKKSLYEIYFHGERPTDPSICGFSEADIRALREAHDAHQAAMEQVNAALSKRGLPFRRIYRARQLNYDPFDLVVSVGGDGTFIEAARRIRTQKIIGVNSDPLRSHGNFCTVTAETLGPLLDQLADGKTTAHPIQRMSLIINGEVQPFQALNDILAAHGCPGAMSRYRLQIGDVEEAQRGSGVWVSTAAGSTGAIRSAGGKVMPAGSKRLQYRCRELFHDRMTARRELRGGILAEDTAIAITSRMREGLICVDGAHLRLPWPAGSRLELARSPFPLQVIGGVNRP